MFISNICWVWGAVRYPLPFDCIITLRTPNVEGLIRDSFQMDWSLYFRPFCLVYSSIVIPPKEPLRQFPPTRPKSKTEWSISHNVVVPHNYHWHNVTTCVENWNTVEIPSTRNWAAIDSSTSFTVSDGLLIKVAYEMHSHSQTRTVGNQVTLGDSMNLKLRRCGPAVAWVSMIGLLACSY